MFFVFFFISFAPNIFVCFAIHSTFIIIYCIVLISNYIIYIFTNRFILNTIILISAILPELLENFENVSAEVVQCPDLTQPPFNLASEGKLE